MVFALCAAVVAVLVGSAAIASSNTPGITPQVFGEPAIVGPPYDIVGVAERSRNIFWYNSSTLETQMWSMEGNAVVARHPVLGEDGRPSFVGPPFSIRGAGDLDGNGSADLVWYNSNTGETQIWFMSGGNVVRRQTVVGEDGRPSFVGPPFSIVAVGDFDKDQRSDLVWHNSSTGETQIWFMSGGNVVRRQTVVGEDGRPSFVGPPFSIVAAGDLDANSQADLLWHNSSTGETQIWFMNGGNVVRRATLVDANGNMVGGSVPFTDFRIVGVLREAPPKIVLHGNSTGRTQVWDVSSSTLQRTRDVVDGQNPPTTSPPTTRPGPQTQFVNLQRQPIVQGFVPYAAQYPPFGVVPPGHLLGIRVPASGPVDIAISFVKIGHSTQECGNSSAVVTLLEGQTTTPAQLTAIYGQAQPPFSTVSPVAFVACVTSPILLDFVQIEITIQS